MNTRTSLLIVSTAAIAGLASFYLANPSPRSPASANPEKLETAASAGPAGKQPSAAAEMALKAAEAVPSGEEPNAETASPPLTPDEVWKERLHTLLTNDTYSDRELGKELLNIVTDGKAPEWAKAHAMANALNFTDDASYAENIKTVAMRLDLPETVNDVILDDLINRDPAQILPVAREIAAIGRHPLAGAIEDFVKSFEELEKE
jgi:hypothetical protein